MQSCNYTRDNFCNISAETWNIDDNFYVNVSALGGGAVSLPADSAVFSYSTLFDGQCKFDLFTVGKAVVLCVTASDWCVGGLHVSAKACPVCPLVAAAALCLMSPVVLQALSCHLVSLLSSHSTECKSFI